GSARSPRVAAPHRRIMTRLMRQDSVDVVVVGGGPGGLVVAERLARSGLQVVVFEEHSTIGEPVHCTGILAAESFDEFDLPRDAILNTLTAARFVSPSGIAVGYTPSAPLAAVIDRPAFDRSLAQRAAAAGAEIRTGVRVSTLDVDRAGAHATVGAATIHAKLAILACGANYAFQ